MIFNKITKEKIARLKPLLPSLLLFAVYFIVDGFFSPIVSIPCVMLLGLAEFIYTRIRKKVYDKMILFTTLFFCIPAGIAVIDSGTIGARLEPAIVETGVCMLLGVFAFSKIDLIAGLPMSIRENLDIDELQQLYMKKKLRMLFFIFCAHTLLSAFALLTQPKNVVDFVCNALPYIIMGLFFSFIFVSRRIALHRTKWEEWLPLVNERGEILGKAARSMCHSGLKLLHPVVHLHIINEKNEFFLQKRSKKKDLLPGYWDTAVGGHVALDEEIEDALKRETLEELGITKLEARFVGKYVWECQKEKELVFSFICTSYNEININNDEVDEGRFWSIKEIEYGIKHKKITPNFAYEFERVFRSGHRKL